jgi:hypothetical protein
VRACAKRRNETIRYKILAELGVICGLLPTASREREFVEQFGTVNPCPRFIAEIRAIRQDK